MLHLEVVSPERVAYSEEVKQLTVPSATGQLTILPNHTSLFAQLVEGELKVIPRERNEPIYMAIGGGFLEVYQNRVTILVTRAVHQDELDEKEILEAKARAEQVLKEKPSPEEYQAARALLRSHLVNLKILHRRRLHRRPSSPQIRE